MAWKCVCVQTLFNWEQTKSFMATPFNMAVRLTCYNVSKYHIQHTEAKEELKNNHKMPNQRSYVAK